MKKLKKDHKQLMIIEAGFIYCKRHKLDNETFIDNVFMTEEFNCSENSEFDNICEDLRYYRYYEKYISKTVTDEEYDMCVEKFGENK